MTKIKYPKLHITLLITYLILYLVVPLVFVMMKQTEIYNASGGSTMVDWFLGFGNLMYVMIVLVFVFSAFPGDTKKGLSFIVSYFLGAGILNISQGFQSLGASLLLQSELIFISMMVTVLVFAIPLLYLAFIKGGVGYMKKDPKLILGLCAIIFMALVSPVGASVIFAQHVFEAQQLLMSGAAMWMVVAVLVATVGQFTYFHYGAIRSAVRDGMSKEKKHKKVFKRN